MEVKDNKSIKLGTVIVACNNVSMYLDFWPTVHKVWTTLVGVSCKLILINDKIPDEFQDYKDDVILFKPVNKIPTAFQAQCIRLLYPCLIKSDDAVIISDMDIIPLSKEYFTTFNVKDKLVNYRGHVIDQYQEIPMCYISGQPKIWQDLFGVKSVEDITTTLKDWYSKCGGYDGSTQARGWTFDQRQLYQVAKQNQDKVIHLDDKQTSFNRLDRSMLANFGLSENVLKAITSNKYTDYHMLRPQSRYQTDNDKIVKSVLS